MVNSTRSTAGIDTNEIGPEMTARAKRASPKQPQPVQAEQERLARAEEFAPEQKAALVDKVHALAR